MPRARDPARNQARDIWDASGGKAILSEIAEQLNVPVSTVRAWKSKDGWDKKNERSAPKKERSAPNLCAPKKPTPEAPKSIEQQLAAAVEENEELTPQQKDFCLYYNRIKNATQAYLKAYGCTYNTAHSEGSVLLAKPSIKAELQRLRDIKAAALNEICGDDLDELHGRIAYADITDFLEFSSKKRTVLKDGAPVMVKNPETGEERRLMHMVNEVNLKSSDKVDGQLIQEISVGRDGGIRLKLADRQKSLAYLERQKLISRIDRERLELERQRIKAMNLAQGGTTSANEQLVEALTEAYKVRKAARGDD